jgi:hypothetical protein
MLNNHKLIALNNMWQSYDITVPHRIIRINQTQFVLHHKYTQESQHENICHVTVRIIMHCTRCIEICSANTLNIYEQTNNRIHSIHRAKWHKYYYSAFKPLAAECEHIEELNLGQKHTNSKNNNRRNKSDANMTD